MRPVFVFLISLTSFIPLAPAATLEVGNNKPYTRIEAALAKAAPGDLILVHPKSDGMAYNVVALQIKIPNLTLRAADPKAFIKIDGDGLNYSGRGPVPRAILQFDPTATGCILEGF